MPRQTAASAIAQTATSSELIGVFRYSFSGRVFKRNLLIALAVGTLLTLANQFDVILRGPVHVGLLTKMCLNFVIPFVVSSVSAYAHRCGP
ncbi:MAG TPA: hypothetical protein VEV41_00585 [Terriglobales bacterium]|nr:hypothetical protein [Terriglobales bacterium]